MSDEPVVQCELCNAELTVNSDDLVNIIRAWEKGAGEGATPKQITDVCLWVYGTAIERSLFLLLKRGEIEIMGMEDGQPQFRAAKNGTASIPSKEKKDRIKESQDRVTQMRAEEVNKLAPKKIPSSAEGKTVKDPSRVIKPPRPKIYSRTRKNWALGKQLWYQDKSAEEIAEVLGCAAITVKKHARTHWFIRPRGPNKKPFEKKPVEKKPAPKKPAPKKPAPKKPAKKVLIRRNKEDYIRCTSCYLNTTTFPCEHCGCEHKELHERMLAP